MRRDLRGKSRKRKKQKDADENHTGSSGESSSENSSLAHVSGIFREVDQVLYGVCTASNMDNSEVQSEDATAKCAITSQKPVTSTPTCTNQVTFELPEQIDSVPYLSQNSGLSCPFPFDFTQNFTLLNTMSFRFPSLVPSVVDPMWFNVDKPCDDEVELEKLEEEHNSWLESIAKKDSHIVPIGKTQSEHMDEDEEDEDDDGDDDDDESDTNDDELDTDMLDERDSGDDAG